MSNNVSHLLDCLNKPQQQAVLQTEGPVLLLAGAGSGKTRVITHRIAYILANKLAKPSEILAVTFTNKASEEMRERVAELVGTTVAKQIMLTTFHSFCVRVLRAHIQQLGYRKDFTISSEGDVRTLVRRVLGDMEGTTETFSPQILLSEISLYKNTDKKPEPPPMPEPEPPAKETKRGHGTKAAAAKETPPEKTAKELTEEKYKAWLPEVYERYQSALRAANTVDFDDLLLLTLELWRDHPAICERFQKHYRYVMVDEYQDTNRVQYNLMKAIVEKRRNLCVVGDDDQSIYGWRGADSRNILDFEQDFPEARVITLDQNYRSTETVLKAANAVIANNTQRRPKNLWSNLGKGRILEWLVTADEEHEAETMAKWLEHIRERAGAHYQDFAVLYRSNLQSRPMEITFRNAGIPYVVIGGQEFFERAEVRDIVAYMKICANPRDEAAFLRIVNMPRRGIGDAALHQIHALCVQNAIPMRDAMTELLKQGAIAGAAANGIREFLAIVEDYRRRFREPNAALSQTARALVEKIGYREELARTSKTPGQFEMRWNNVQAVFGAVEQYEKNAEKPSLYEFLDDNSLNTDEDRRSKKDRRASGVTLMTVHSAKGLEFPFVFIAGCEEGLLPHDKSVREAIAAGSPGIEEERRLFYVAVTRGKRHVTFFEALSRNRFGRNVMTETSRFLKEVPEDLVHKRFYAQRDMVEERVAPPKPKPKPRRRPNKRG